MNVVHRCLVIQQFLPSPIAAPILPPASRLESPLCADKSTKRQNKQLLFTSSPKNYLRIRYSEGMLRSVLHDIRPPIDFFESSSSIWRRRGRRGSLSKNSRVEKESGGRGRAKAERRKVLVEDEKIGR